MRQIFPRHGTPRTRCKLGPRGALPFLAILSRRLLACAPRRSTMRRDSGTQTTCWRPAKARAHAFASPSLFRVIWVVAVSLCCLPAILSAQGFGKFEKSKLTLHRKLPPVVHFTGSTFSVKTTSRDTKTADATASLTDLLETELLKDNSRLRVEANSPELAITCNVISFETPAPQAFTRNEVVLQKGKQVE